MRDRTSLLAWQTAREVAITSARLAQAHWHPSRAETFSQLTRAALSVRLNIAEGYAFTNTPTFRRHLDIAYGSAIETGELIEHAAATGMLPESDTTALLARVKLCQRLTYGLLLHVKNKNRRPPPQPP